MELPPAGRPVDDLVADPEAVRRAAVRWSAGRAFGGAPDSLHATVSNPNTGVIDDELDGLRVRVDEVAGITTGDRSANDATLE